MRRLLTLVALLSVALTSLAQSDPYARVDVGDKLPVFSVRMMDGTTMESADLEGRVVWVCLWASWCPSCRKEFGWFAESAEFAALLESEDFIFLPIAREENTATVRAWLTKKGYPYISGEDPERAIYELFAEQEIPRNILVGRDGTIALHSTAYSRKSLTAVVEMANEMLKN